MNATIEYGSIAASNTGKEKQTSSVCGSKALYAVIACLLLFSIGIYLSSGHFAPSFSAPLAQMALGESASTADYENCALQGDESCDEKYGCHSYEEDIEAVMDIVSKRWDDYVEYIEAKTDASLEEDECIADKYLDKHLVCTRSCDKLAYSMESASEQPNLCKNTFLDEMKTTLRPYRRACIASILAHQFQAVCQGKGNLASQVEIATFTWWARNYGVSEALWTHADCPYYI